MKTGMFRMHLIRKVFRISTPYLLSLCKLSSKSSIITKMSVTTSAYGSWRSPISSKIVSESSVKFQEVHVDSNAENAGMFSIWILYVNVRMYLCLMTMQSSGPYIYLKN